MDNRPDGEKSEWERIEELSAILHSIYMKEATRQGDVRHDYDYSKLRESTKEYDRVLARYILERESLLESRLKVAEGMAEALDCMINLPITFICRSAKHKCREALTAWKKTKGE